MNETRGLNYERVGAKRWLRPALSFLIIAGTFAVVLICLNYSLRRRSLRWDDQLNRTTDILWYHNGCLVYTRTSNISRNPVGLEFWPVSIHSTKLGFIKYGRGVIGMGHRDDDNISLVTVPKPSQRYAQYYTIEARVWPIFGLVVFMAGFVQIRKEVRKRRSARV